MRVRFHFGYWLILGLTVACTQEVELNPEIFDYQPVLTGMLKAGQPSILHFGMTSGILTTEQTFPNWIEFNLLDSNKLLVKEENHDLHNILIPGNFLKEKSRYTVILKLSNGLEISATDSIPMLVRIDQAAGIRGKTYDVYGTAHSDYSITFTDPGSIRNYYELFFINQKWLNSKVETSYHCSVELADPIIQAEGMLDYHPTSFIFSDDLFNGQVCTLNMKMLNEGSPHIWLDEPIIDAGDGTYFILRSVSKTYYDFRKSWLLHKRTQNRGSFDEEPLASILIGNPTSLMSNVKNGYGILACYAQDYIKVEIKIWQ